MGHGLRGDRLWIRDMLQTGFWVGFTAALPIFGRLSDARGPRFAFTASSAMMVVGLGVSALAPSLTCYGFARALVGTACGGGGLSSYVYGYDWMSSSRGRAFYSTAGINFFYIGGELLVVGLATRRFAGPLSEDDFGEGHGGANVGFAWWRSLTLLLAAVAFTILAPASAFLVESPR